MSTNNIFARKRLESLQGDAEHGERLHRALGPWSLTAMGIGCIIGAGIFVMTGRAAALDAGPAVILSYAIAGLGCAMAALCYAEFAAMAPVAGSAYTYAYATLGEIFAWIIGWDLILEYAMGCATVASAWTKYFNKLLPVIGLPPVPDHLSQDPFHGGWLNLPSVVIMVLVTIILVIGIRESARTNAILVAIKLGVVLFVIAAGSVFVNPANWTSIPIAQRRFQQELDVIPDAVKKYQKDHNEESKQRAAELNTQAIAAYRIERKNREIAEIEKAGGNADNAKKELAVLNESVKAHLPESEADKKAVAAILNLDPKEEQAVEVKSWGLLGVIGLNRWLVPIDDAVRSPFMPYGISGIMLGAAIVFFAFIGFDSISTQAEEAKRPQRDLPIGILLSLAVCTLLYIAVSAVVTGMMPYPDINTDAPIAAAFDPKPGAPDTPWLMISRGLIAAGGLAGMTSVLLVLFLSQARIFMAMSRDGLLPKVFSTVHPKFRTPHVATILTGIVICFTAALTPIYVLEEMVNVGTLMAFAMVCAAVWVLRAQRPTAERPFRCPAIWIVAPAGILINVLLTLFLSPATWIRLLGWLAAGLVIYFSYSNRHSHISEHLLHEIATPHRKEYPEPEVDPNLAD
jgi:APA family basic amino acid/polyamine antiporter